MSANAVTYPFDWSKETTEEGDETYTLQWHVETTSPTDGPDVAWTAPGLPYIGASLAVGGTVNPWAFFQGKGSAKLKKVDANRKFWDLTTVFSTKPVKRCSSSKVDDPLLEPHRVKGSFTQVMEEALADASGNPIQNTVKQRYTGSVVQTPKCRPIVELEMNVSWINLAFLADYADTVNSNIQWGQAVRTIKCTVGPWERVLYGSCFYYFVGRFTFELKTDKWDLHLPNLASRERVLNSSPWTYKSYKLADEENSKGFVDATTGYATATANFLDFRVLKEKDFSVVGWPASLI
jgi:hypothetical protein